MKAILVLLLVQTALAHPCDTVHGDFDTWLDTAEDMDVVVVGGGAAGLSATKELLLEGQQKVVLLEALDRLGGRVSTIRTRLNSGEEVLTEDGAEWVHGGRGNFLYHLAKDRLQALAPTLGKNDWVVWIKQQDGRNADRRGFDAAKRLLIECDANGTLDLYYKNTNDQGYGQCHIDKFDSTYQKLEAPAAERDAWYHYVEQYFNKDMGTDSWLDVAARDGDHFTDWGYDQWDQWKDGYDTLVTFLKKSIPDDKVKLSSPVCQIYWDEEYLDRALVVTQTGESFLAKHVLITTSVGYLKERHTQLFIPALPSSFTESLSGVELGVADKIQLGWEEPWWGDKPLDLTVIWTERNLPQHKEWLYGILEFLGVHQEPSFIQAFISGKYARAMEDLSEDVVKNDILSLLSDIAQRDIPDPIFFRRTTWGKYEWFYGSYNSFVTPEGSNAGLIDRSSLAKPIRNSQGNQVILWAGEHTHTTRYGTVDGAMEKGQLMAKELKRMLN